MVNNVLLFSLDAVSVIVSLLVGWNLTRLPRNLRRRTTPKLMMWLALLDICFHSLHTVWWILNVELGMIWWPFDSSGYHWHTTILQHAVGVIFIYGNWMEVANAAAIFLRSIRRGLHILPWLLHLAVALATAISGCMLLSVLFLSKQVYMCILFGSATTAAFLSCASLAVVACRASRSGQAVATRQRRNAALWIANALLTNMVYGIVGFTCLLFPATSALLRCSFPLGFIAVNAKGALNGYAIFYSSRYSNKAIADIGKLKNLDDHSFHVDLTGGVEAMEIRHGP